MAAIWKEDRQKIKDDQRTSAFTGWQFYTILKQTGFLGNAPLVKYDEYLGNLGLLTDTEKEQLAAYKKLKREQNKVEAAYNIQSAQAIADMVRRQRSQT